MASIGKRGDKWHVRICKKNNPTICKTFSLLRDAQAWAKSTELRLERGEALGRETVLLSELVERYIKTVSPTKKGHRQELPRLNAWLRHSLANREAATIKPVEIASYRDKRLKDGLASASVRIELSVLSAVFKCARYEWGYSLLPNPVAEIKRPAPSKGRQRRLETGELEVLLGITRNSELSTLIVFAIETAMRAGEIVGLRWDDINLTKRTATLPDTKNGTQRVVPLSSKAIAILAELPRVARHVFSVRHSYSISNAFKRATSKAGITGLHFHDLRHEAVSRLFEQRFNTMEVASISGHKSLQMLQRYTHLRAEDLALRME